jgi:hypothetical protein
MYTLNYIICSGHMYKSRIAIGINQEKRGIFVLHIHSKVSAHNSCNHRSFILIHTGVSHCYLVCCCVGWEPGRMWAWRG